MKKAFTLIELIATIVILGVVTSIVSILIMNVIRNVKDSANRRSIDNYGRIADTAMSEYQSQYLKYPTSFDELNIEYTGSKVECNISRINPDKTIYLSECKVNGKKVLDKKTEDGYYHYGTLVLTNEEYVDKLGNNIELALKDYYEENNKYPINYRLLNLPKLDKDVNCVSEIHQDGTVYLTKCSIDGSYILNENEEDGYYHYGSQIMYDYTDKDGNYYTEVEYIDSTGDKFIDTEFMADSNTEVEMVFKTTQKITNNAFLFGSRFSLDNNEFGVFYDSKNYVARYQTSNQNYVLGDYSNELIKIGLSKNGYVFNNNSLNISGNIEKKNNIYIFGMNTGDEFTSGSSYQLYSFKIKENNSLVRDYVPVEDKNENKCLFDKVEKKCYYLLEEGQFQTTNYYDNSHNKYTRVHYIESTGVQYIDTLYKTNTNTTVDLKIITPNAIKQGCFLFASRGSDYYSDGFGVFYKDGYIARFATNNNYSSDISFSSNDKVNISLNRNRFILKDKIIKISGGNINSVNNLYIFSANTGGTSTAYSDYRLMNLKIYDCDDLVRNYIPVLDETDRPCLFDKVESKCYYNQGTGEFLYG